MPWFVMTLTAVVMVSMPWSAVHATAGSKLAADAQIVFIGTDARLDEARAEWIVPVHVWVNEPEKSVVRKAAFAEVLEQAYGLRASSETTRQNFERRVGELLVDNERGKRIVVAIGERTFELPGTGANGHALAEFRVPAAEVERLAVAGRLGMTAVLREGDARVFAGWSELVEPEGVSVVSDIDDTVKLTEVTDFAAMLERTFFLDFEAVPGMAALYRAWAAQGARFHFVSSSPWHFYAPLAEFTAHARFPSATFALKLVRFKDKTLFDLFKKGTETKPVQIERLLAAYPGRRFVLVGDSGEEDPEVYGRIAREHPGRISGIFIRNVTDATRSDARFSGAFSGLDPALWRLFDNPAGLELP
jgi:phosphatidate phosphatase APP1